MGSQIGVAFADVSFKMPLQGIALAEIWRWRDVIFPKRDCHSTMHSLYSAMLTDVFDSETSIAYDEDDHLYQIELVVHPRRRERNHNTPFSSRDPHRSPDFSCPM